MESVIQALNLEMKNILIKSETGTGKTLAYLCSILGWLNKTKSFLS